ncbi:unnamed protein product, partial [Prorocentrum cordatum]
ALLPYDPTHDSLCSWVSQWTLSLLAGGLFRGRVLMYPAVSLFNPGHGGYPKTDCMKHLTEAAERVRRAAPQRVRSCFPDPPPPSVIFVEGKVQLGSYLPWGSVQKKLGVNYSDARLSDIAPCDDEPTVQALAEPARASWCRGCSLKQIIVLLQMMIADKPIHPPNWNELGVRLLSLGSDIGTVTSAFWCFTVASRLVQVSEKPAIHEVDRNVFDTRAFLENHGVQIPDMTQEAAWQERGGPLMDRVLPPLLELPVPVSDLPGPGMERALSDVRIRHLVEHLT